jgi:hypothetical protein
MFLQDLRSTKDPPLCCCGLYYHYRSFHLYCHPPTALLAVGFTDCESVKLCAAVFPMPHLDDLRAIESNQTTLIRTCARSNAIIKMTGDVIKFEIL